jgi:archaeosine synthase beta-subunit
LLPSIRSGAYPRSRAERDRWILARRGPRAAADLHRAARAAVENERTERGDVASVVTLFLTNRECPWRCLMCDLWKSTTAAPVRPGAVPEQIRQALDTLPAPRPTRIKLYNSGSFFDTRAIPTSDLPAIAAALAGFERVIVESHPALVGDSCLRWRDRIDCELEVAIGLETVHPEILRMLNKRMTLADFQRAADRLRRNRIALRAFVLLGLPFLSAAESAVWIERSIETAFDAGATAVSVIPTRSGNGAMDELAASGEFMPPGLAMLERAVAFGVSLGRGRVFADLWDVERLPRCPACFSQRVERLRGINLTQAVARPVDCADCEGQS